MEKDKKDLKCPMPNCKSNWIDRKSSLEEFNPKMEIYVCLRCMCHFRKDGTIIKDGDFEKYERLYKESKERKRKRKKRKVKKKASRKG